MLNIEYYKDELVGLGIIDLDRLAVGQGQPRICNNSILCRHCLFNNNNHSFSCSDDALKWLLTEYKEPKEPEVDWSKVKVDTPILVKDTEEGEWRKRHFSGFKNGKVYAWCDGATSWTADGKYDVNSWKYAKLAESEE